MSYDSAKPLKTVNDVEIKVDDDGYFYARLGTPSGRVMRRKDLRQIEREIAKLRPSSGPTPVLMLSDHSIGAYTEKVVTYFDRDKGANRWRSPSGDFAYVGGAIYPDTPETRAACSAFELEAKSLQNRWEAFVDSLDEVKPDDDGNPRIVRAECQRSGWCVLPGYGQHRHRYNDERGYTTTIDGEHAQWKSDAVAEIMAPVRTAPAGVPS